MAEQPQLLTAEAVRLGCTATDRFDAIRQAGEVLVGLGAVEPPYVDAMAERERSLSSYMGEGFSLPHGTDEARAFVRRPTLAFLQFPDGVEWEDGRAHACIAIAVASDEHVSVMARIARILVEPDQAEELRTATDVDRVLALLEPEPVATTPEETP